MCLCVCLPVCFWSVWCVSHVLGCSALTFPTESSLSTGAHQAGWVNGVSWKTPAILAPVCAGRGVCQSSVVAGTAGSPAAVPGLPSKGGSGRELKAGKGVVGWLTVSGSWQAPTAPCQTLPQQPLCPWCPAAGGRAPMARYLCSCPPGYQGTWRCRSDVDECRMGGPCRHGGTCLNCAGSLPLPVPRWLHWATV